MEAAVLFTLGRTAADPGRLHADRLGRGRRGRVHPHHRRRDALGGRPDDRAGAGTAGDRVAKAPPGTGAMCTRTSRCSRAEPGKRVFLVNPAAANGSTGRRWPELARRAAAAGLEGDTLLSERPGHLGDLAREGGRRGSDEARRRGRRRDRPRGRRRAREGWGGRPRRAGGRAARHGLGLRAQRSYPDAARRALEVAREAEVRDDRRRTRDLRRRDGREAAAYFANFAGAGISGAIAKRANEHDEGARGQGLVSCGRRSRCSVAGRPAEMTVEIDGGTRQARCSRRWR